MGLESATYVTQLVETNPLGSDPRNQADDHLRLIKACVKNSFPQDLRNVASPLPGQSLRYSASNGGGFANIAKFCTYLSRTSSVNINSGTDYDVVWENEIQDDYGLFANPPSTVIKMPNNIGDFQVWVGIDILHSGTNGEIFCFFNNITSSLRWPGGGAIRHSEVTTSAGNFCRKWFLLAPFRGAVLFGADLPAPNVNDDFKIMIRNLSGGSITLQHCRILFKPAF